MNNVNIPVVQGDIRMAEQVFGANNVFWDEDLRWIQINNYLLPAAPRYKPERTNCLIMLPPGYGFGMKLEEFYVDMGIVVKKGRSWVPLPHYYDRNIQKGISLNGQAWHWLCIHPEWQPGDRLLNFMKQIEWFFKLPFDEPLI